MTPAISAVPAATMPMEAPTARLSTWVMAVSRNFGAPEISSPSLSVAVPMINGLSAMMYAIAKNVTRPPRTSWLVLEPRRLIPKNRSNDAVRGELVTTQRRISTAT